MNEPTPPQGLVYLSAQMKMKRDCVRALAD